MGTITVVRPGALTTVQDLGRLGYGASGVPRGGAFDPWAARFANRLVGNPDDAALLEITLAGPTLDLDGIAAVALVGDPFEIELDGEPVAAAMASRFEAKERSRLKVGRRTAGVRAWLAFAGGIDTPAVLGSRATDLAGGFGGHQGRSLRVGDHLSVAPAISDRAPSPFVERARAENEAKSIRILSGPDRALLVGDLEELAAVEWRVSPNSDRRGVRLTGGRIELAPHSPLRSQATLPGAIQIPPSGEPIVLGVDAPVTGGYPWVAQVIEADLGRLAHLAPGAAVRFELVDLVVAGNALAERRRQLEAETDG